MPEIFFHIGLNGLNGCYTISDLKRRMSSWGRLHLGMSALRQCFSLTLTGNHKKTSS